ncbi:MAG: hypothetical protein ISS45_03590 [Candidatus Omnitrophica bacterium]|nr:hypothetical protein [Candidatus Omnitrophota bacterium]
MRDNCKYFYKGIFVLCPILLLSVCLFCATLSFAEINFEDFKNPPQEYSVAPFWFLNGDLKKDTIISQMKEMHDKGIGIVIPHARTGLIQEYLGEEWFDAYRVILSTAKELGVKVVIYDEYNWPTGRAGYFIPMNYPEFRNKLLFCKKYPVQGPGELGIIENKGIIKHLFIAEDTKEGLNFARRDELIKNNEIAWNIPKGSWIVLTFVEGSGGSVDLMNPKMVEQFISLTHERYYKRFKAYFGNTIIGFCFDEPIISSWPNFPLPWSGVLEEEFLRKYRYSLIDNLPCLFFEVNDSPKVRQDFYSLVSAKFEKSFFCQLSDWTKSHGNIFYCGHLMNDDNLYGNLQTGGDVFDLLRNIQVPGFDWAGDYRLSPVNGRVFSSIAELIRKKRVSCEIFGATGWAFPTWKMKRDADWAFLLGANMLIPHAFFYTVKGVTQLNDYPPSLFTPQPYWEEFKLFADYLKRCSYILANSKRISNIALLYPMGAMMQAYTPLEKKKEAESIDRDFEDICRGLFERKLDFKIIDEDLLKNAHVLDKKLIAKDDKYTILIISALRGLKKGTAALIEKMKREGLEIYVLKGEQENTGQDIAQIIQNTELTLNGRMREKKFFNASKEIYWSRHQSGAKTFFYISNQSETLWGEIEFLLSDVNSTLWDPLKGKIYSVFKAKRLIIPPLYSFFLEAGVTDAPQNSNNLPDYFLKEADEEMLIQGEWQISGEGSDKKITLAQIQPLDDIKAFSGFSGQACYKTAFNLPKPILSQNKIYLELEDVRHAARIFLNNHKVGDIFWSPGFFDVTPLLKENNVLELEIYNTFANAVSAMSFGKDDIRSVYIGDKKGGWVKFEKEDLEYGLLKPPKLLLFKQ